MTRGARAGHYRRVQLHLVGGFLGSGKTTAIASACELLRERGLRAAVVTNDQGEMLVDTGALAGIGVATAEVTGGCFCCRYDELVERIAALAADGAEHLFAEAVGSCVDIARTVVNPLLQRREVALEAITFSVLADVRLLADLLAGRPLPWSNPALRYLFERQLAEARCWSPPRPTWWPPRRATGPAWRTRCRPPFRGSACWYRTRARRRGSPPGSGTSLPLAP